EFLRQQLPAPDSVSQLELWNAAGERIAHAGRAVPVREAGLESSWSATRQALGRLIDSLNATDSAQFSPLVRQGDMVIAWIVAPILVRGELAGYLSRSFRLMGGPQTQQTLRALSGTEVSVYYRNNSGNVWTTLGGTPSTPPDVAHTDSSHRAVRHEIGEL